MVIEVEHLVKRYGPVVAVDGVCFTVGKGEIFGMLGPNGAGKTTTVEIIEGLRRADSGRVAVLGMEVVQGARRIKDRIGVQLQAPALYPMLTVSEVLRLFASFYSRSIPLEKALALMSLEESRHVLVKNLSGGQQQRLSVALAFINDPEILFLDEPTTGLDPQARRKVWQVIREMQESGKTVFLTTHYMEEAEELCHRVAIIDRGRIIALDSPQNLVGQHFKESAIQFEAAGPLDSGRLGSVPGVKRVVLDNSEVTLYTENIASTVSGLLSLFPGASQALKNLYVRQSTLEDVFLKLTGRRIRD